MRTVFFASVIAAGLAGCASTPLISEKQAATTVAPPAPRAEVPPAPTSSDQYWVAGAWRWDNGRYAWESGRWVDARPDAVYVQGTWFAQGDYWIGTPAHWQPVLNGRPVATIASRPPMPLLDPIGVAPGPDYVWASGYWQPDGNRANWVAGRWQRIEEAQVWESARWVPRYGQWAYVPGRWTPNRLGFDRSPAGTPDTGPVYVTSVRY